MKKVTVLIIFALFLTLSAFMSEYSMKLLKHYSGHSPNDKNVSFIYGWVEYQGKKHFFIQENHFFVAIQQAHIFLQDKQTKAILPIEDAIAEVCTSCRLISFKQAPVYDSLKAMKQAKQKMIKMQSSVFKISLKHFRG